MKEVSNSSMTFYKSFLPLGWFFVFGIITLIGIFGAIWGAAVVGAIFCCFGFVVFKKYVWPLPDHVYLDATELVIEKDQARTSVSLAHLMDVRFDQSLQLVTVTFSGRSPIETVSFKPKLGFLGSSESSVPKIVEEIFSAADAVKKRR